LFQANPPNVDVVTRLGVCRRSSTSVQRKTGVNQAAVFEMERRADMYISTLQSMIRAMGGQLKIEAVFPEGKVEINQFRKLKKSAGAD
jgi:hypothetical protein